MKMVLGVDIGGSTTKIVLFEEEKQIADTLQVKANDQITSLYGAVGNILHKNNLPLQKISNIVLTGVGASLISGDVYGIPTCKVNEFEAIGAGGLLLSNLDEALVVSMGTGTAFVKVSDGKTVHIGGSGVGGGTLLGLSSKLINEHDIEAVIAAAESGNLQNVDLSISEISNTDILSLPPTATASNFGKIKSVARDSDMALGLLNMVFQTAGMLAVFACMDTKIKNVVVTGSVATLPQAKPILHEVGLFHNLSFTVPENAAFATAIGAAALYFTR